MGQLMHPRLAQAVYPTVVLCMETEESMSPTHTCDCMQPSMTHQRDDLVDPCHIQPTAHLWPRQDLPMDLHLPCVL